MKRIQNIILVCLLISLAGCASNEPQPVAKPEELIPRKLDFSFIGIVGPAYHVERAEGFLIYTVTQPGQKPGTPLHLTPSPEKWREFRHQLDRLKVWQWQPAYGGNSFIGGTQWTLDIQYADSSVRSQGHSDFPRHYDAFLKALGKLLGSWDIQYAQ